MTHIERRRLWQQHIEDWQASGLSGMAYCRKRSNNLAITHKSSAT